MTKVAAEVEDDSAGADVDEEGYCKDDPVHFFWLQTLLREGI